MGKAAALSHCIFFFQAEDGIRDGRVTGVQTCALPISTAFHPKNAVVINARSFSRLPDAQKKTLIYAASTAETRGWAMSRVRQLEANEMLTKNGMTIHEPDAGMKAAFGKVGHPTLGERLKT